MASPFSTKEHLIKIRETMHEGFSARACASMEIIDSLCVNQIAKCPTELSLNHPMTRQYSSISDAISHCFGHQEPEKIANSLISSIAESMIDEVSASDPVFHIADKTSLFRPDAHTLEDRQYVHGASNTIGPSIGVGHAYSLLAHLPGAQEGHWLLPLNIKRVHSSENGIDVGVEQFISATQLKPFQRKLNVMVGDCEYSSIHAISKLYSYEDKLLLAKARSTRNFYIPAQVSSCTKKGRKPWYGQKFKLNNPATHCEPDDSLTLGDTTARGKPITIELKRYNDLLMRGTRAIHMHDKPSDLVQVMATRDDGSALFTRPMWLIVSGKQRKTLTLETIYRTYMSRFDIEHLFRFSKQRLLFKSFQTPITGREENWVALVMLAYLQLYAAAPLCADRHLRSWERYVMPDDGLPTPAQTQRAFATLLKQIGTPAYTARPRGNPLGRSKGQTKVARAKAPPIKKTKPPGKRKQVVNIHGSKEKASSDKPLKLNASQIKILAKVCKLTRAQISALRKAA